MDRIWNVRHGKRGESILHTQAGRQGQAAVRSQLSGNGGCVWRNGCGQGLVRVIPPLGATPANRLRSQEAAV